jgi:hypothetical protein
LTRTARPASAWQLAAGDAAHASQISDLCMDLYRRGFFKEPTHNNRGYARTTEDVLVERKPTSKVRAR